MRKKVSVVPAVAIILTILMAAPVVSLADLYWESTLERKGVSGKPDSSEVIVNYLKEGASRTDFSDHIVIMRVDTRTLFQINPTEKTYHRISLEEMGRPPAGISGEQAAAQLQVMKEMMGKIQVTPTGESRKIGEYLCRKYLVSGMMMTGEYWLSRDVPGYAELKRAAEKMKEVFDSNPMMKQMNITGMMSQLDGFPVQVTQKVLNGSLVTTLKSIEMKQLDDSLFAVPPGYAEVLPPMASGGKTKN
jgi:hypothetical protein